MLLFACLEQSFLSPEQVANRVINIMKIYISLTGGIRSAMLRRVSVLRFVRCVLQRDVTYLTSFLRSLSRASSSLSRAYAARSRFIFIMVIASSRLLRERRHYNYVQH